MGRPRKHATAAEAAEVRRMQDRERRRIERAPAHAAKADPTKRKDAFVNAKNWPVAPLNDDTLAIISRLIEEAGQSRYAGLRTKSAALMMGDWQEQHKLKLPQHIPVDGGDVVDKRVATLGAVWNELQFTLRYTLEMIIPRADRRIRREVKEKADADALGITVSELRNRRDATAISKHKRKQADAVLREQGERLLEKRARDDAQRLQELADFGRF